MRVHSTRHETPLVLQPGGILGNQAAKKRLPCDQF